MTGEELRARYGPWALVTGAAQGIGEALARELVRHGLRVVLVDRQAERLQQVAQSLGSDRVRVLVEDLGDPESVERITAAVADIELGLLAQVAAISVLGDVLDEDPAALQATIDVNCRAPLMLTRALAPALRERRRGGVLLMSSLAAWQGAPGLAAYAASRAYTLSLAQSLWSELRPHGVDVLGVCPGATRTPAFEALLPDPEVLRAMPLMEPAAVAREVLARLSRGPVWVVGRSNRLVHALLTRVLTRRLTNQLMAHNLGRLYRR
ncbi:SDR family NAD(P)-dependent oxidoreductase [Paraliomyxa miuraensis]|uniref:SDR family NAD(P)-dependent oxidoreductase n=1 Tax=Paraliomyxa miuraensis TaxID=376150 RepID=UPI002253C613|nr:SDR family NAD(P)-dependent oxidoreductase [Paraliomyxa miuraensis]MCX4242188.1 SDR family NAD(P)-dependent oxidoreductase [Paraliomyxa miuraensis]